jgi:hypothetical protein
VGANYNCTCIIIFKRPIHRRESVFYLLTDCFQFFPGLLVSTRVAPAVASATHAVVDAAEVEVVVAAAAETTAAAVVPGSTSTAPRPGPTTG